MVSRDHKRRHLVKKPKHLHSEPTRSFDRHALWPTEGEIARLNGEPSRPLQRGPQPNLLLQSFEQKLGPGIVLRKRHAFSQRRATRHRRQNEQK
jgi:hypothetical protein